MIVALAWTPPISSSPERLNWIKTGRAVDSAALRTPRAMWRVETLAAMTARRRSCACAMMERGLTSGMSAVSHNLRDQRAARERAGT